MEEPDESGVIMDRSSWHIIATYMEDPTADAGDQVADAEALERAINAERGVRRPAVTFSDGTVTVTVLVEARSPGVALRDALDAIERARTAVAPRLLGDILRETVRPVRGVADLDTRQENVRRLLDPSTLPTSQEEWFERTRWTRKAYYEDRLDDPP
jgi:hypothetical protein